MCHPSPNWTWILILTGLGLVLSLGGLDLGLGLDNYSLDSQMKLELMYNKVKLFFRCVIWIQIRDFKKRNMKTGNSDLKS